MGFGLRWPWRRPRVADAPDSGDGLRSTFDWLATDHGRGAGWAHVSGWMLLSRRRRNLSCVIPSCGDASLLLSVMPTLCDRLTEGGFPWEMLVVDASGEGRVAAAAAALASTVPLRVAASSRRASRADALLSGIGQARGDGVLLADPTMVRWLDTVPALIERWAEGELAVSCHGLMADEAPDLPRPSEGLIDTRDFGQTDGSLVLLDRRLVDTLASP